MTAARSAVGSRASFDGCIWDDSEVQLERGAMRAIYKICSAVEWEEAQRTGGFVGSSIDRRDGFIHFSTRDQVSETAARYFSDLDGLVLVMVDADALGHRLKWEPARGGALFPHPFGPLDTAAAIWVKKLPADNTRASYLANLPID
jgi:uncharacterized protein (DUF952 family)